MQIASFQKRVNTLRFCAAALVLLTVIGASAQSVAAKKQSGLSHPPLVRDREFTSKSLGRSVRYRVIVPGDYDRNTRRYPILYLLHGLNGGYDNWETRTNLTFYAAKYQFIIVMPDVGDSWYVNSATVPEERYETFFLEDLVPEVEHSWRVLRASHRRAVAGLSMGGYGAIKFALRYPGMFAFAGSISGALNAPTELADLRPDFAKNLAEVFGAADSETRKKNDIYVLAREAKASESLYFYIDCGNADWALPSNREFVKILTEKRFRYEYHEMPGMHAWEYWDRRLPDLLGAVAKRISQP
jgi:putative tributyrin esterase